MGWSTKGTPGLFEWGTAAKDKVDAEEVGGWRASGWREQPVGGRAISTSRIALGAKRTGRRGCVGKEGNNVGVHVPFLPAGRAERTSERPR
jgi:hypothetical protein